MAAIATPRDRRSPVEFAVQPYVMRVGDEECTVRAAAICTIAEALEAVDEQAALLAGAWGAEPCDEGMVADLLASRMIAAPRRQRRRDRAVSSRAVFYAASDA